MLSVENSRYVIATYLFYIKCWNVWIKLHLLPSKWYIIIEQVSKNKDVAHILSIEIGYYNLTKLTKVNFAFLMEPDFENLQLYVD